MKRILGFAVCVAIGLCVFWCKVCVESDTAMYRALGEGADNPAGRAAQLTLSAQQDAPGARSAQAVVLLEEMATRTEGSSLGRAGLAAASGGARNVGRPYQDSLRRTGIKVPDTPAPNPWLGLFASVMFVMWIGLTFAWIFRGHNAKGRPIGRRWPWAVSVTASVLAWVVSSWMV